ncbi:MAG: SLBB domain-containing protein [Clostridia bacterium]|nr:SLBB domain-containing protein [Clostridia bacterium]
MNEELKKRIQDGAVVGAGGAGFPSYAKLAAGADTLVINASECEPLLDTDYILMREHMDKVVDGAKIIMECADIPRTLLCLKEHNAHRLSLTEGQKLAEGVFVKTLPDVYPIGDELATIYEATGRLVSPGNLPITKGVIVYNVETLVNVSFAVREGKPVTEKWLTIGGDVEKSVVLRVPVGMRVRDLFKKFGIVVPEGYAVIDGGPSMGQIINPNIAVVKKSTKGLLILPELIPAVAGKKGDIKTQISRASSMCCQCTRCTDMCPRNLLGYPLYPHKMVRTAINIAEMTPDMILTASLCCSCGVCETAACCQNISPRNVILEFKSILAKNRMKYVATEDVVADEYRDSRLIPISRWKAQLGVTPFDREGVLVDPIETVGTVEIGLNWHIGAPSVLAVKVGDVVKKGDKIADAAGGLSVPAYASIDGKVIYADDKKVVIESV